MYQTKQQDRTPEKDFNEMHMLFISYVKIKQYATE